MTETSAQNSKAARNDAGKEKRRFRGIGWALLLGGFYAAANLLGGMLENDGYLSAPTSGQAWTALVQWVLFTAVICLIWAALDGRFPVGRRSRSSSGRTHRNADGQTDAAASEFTAAQGGLASGSDERRTGPLRAGLTRGLAAWDALPDRRKDLILWLVMMAVDMVSLLAVYPGFFLYDATEELAMVQTRTFTNHHPLVHVLLMGFVILAVHKITGSYNLAIFCYIFLQMMVILAAFTYMLHDLRRRGAGRGQRIFSFLWLILCPTITMFVLCSVKDGLFSAALIVMTVELRRMIMEPEMFFAGVSSGVDAKTAPRSSDDVKVTIHSADAAEGEKAEPDPRKGRRYRMTFVLSAAAMMLFRKNGVYAYVVFLALLLLAGVVLALHHWVTAGRKSAPQGRAAVPAGSGPAAGDRCAEGTVSAAGGSSPVDWDAASRDAAGAQDSGTHPAGGRRTVLPLRYWRRGLLLIVLALVIYYAVDTTLVTVTNADTSEKQEMLSVSLTQLARTWASDPDSFTEEEKDLMDALMTDDGWEKYKPNQTDQMRMRLDNEVYTQNSKEYWDMWLRQAIAHPMTYLNAWFMTSYGYWYPDAIIDCYEGNIVFTFTYGDSSYFGYETEQPGERQSFFPALDAFYRYLSLDADAQRIPVVHYLMSCGAMFWFFAFLLVTLLRNGRYNLLIVYLPILLVWLTILLGACNLPRFVIYLWFGLPMFLSEILFIR